MPTTGLDGVKVGDPLILVTGNRYRGDENVTVARIGRVYLYVARADGHELLELFDRKTGAEDRTTGTKQHLYTAAQYDELKQRDSLFEQLRTAGITIEWKIRDDLSAGQLRELLAVITPDA